MKFAGRSYYQAIFFPVCYFFFLPLWMAFKIVVNFSYLTKIGFCFPTNTLITRLYCLISFFFCFSNFYSTIFQEFFLRLTAMTKGRCLWILLFMKLLVIFSACFYEMIGNDRKQNNQRDSIAHYPIILLSIKSSLIQWNDTLQISEPYQTRFHPYSNLFVKLQQLGYSSLVTSKYQANYHSKQPEYS